MMHVSTIGITYSTSCVAVKFKCHTVYLEAYQNDNTATYSFLFQI